MKKVKKMIPVALAGAIAMLFCGAVFADDMGMGKSEKEKATMEQKMVKKQATRLDMMTDKLALTPTQKDQVSTIFKGTAEQKKALMVKMDADMKDIRATEDTQIKAVLTPEQQTKYDQMMIEHRAKMDKR